MEYLWSLVKWTASEGRRDTSAVAETEISKLEVILAGLRYEEDVLRLHVPADDALRCQAIDRLEHLLEDGLAELGNGDGDATLD